jgi:hypothetical protein
MKSKVAITSTFDEVKNLIYLLCWEFSRGYRIDHEVCIAEGYYAFLQAYDSFDISSDVPFSNWVKIKVMSRLKDLLRKRIKESKRFVSLTDEHDKAKEVYSLFDIKEWLKGLSKDGRKVAKLVLYPPMDIKWYLGKFGYLSGGNYRQALREVLREMDWDEDRIKNTFIEIKEHLK